MINKTNSSKSKGMFLNLASKLIILILVALPILLGTEIFALKKEIAELKKSQEVQLEVQKTSVTVIEDVAKSVIEMNKKLDNHIERTDRLGGESRNTYQVSRGSISREREKYNINRQKIWDHLINSGIQPHAAAGIIGNLSHESELDPRKLNGGSRGDLVIGGPAYGIAQWCSYNRQKGLANWAAKNGGDPGDLDIQLSYLVHEMGPKFINRLNNCDTVQEAAIIFMTEFERPGDSSHDRRINHAVESYKTL